MATEQLNLIAPLAAPLPPPPDGDVLSPEQWTTLLSIGDTIIPSIAASASQTFNTLVVPADEFALTREAIPDTSLAQAYLAENASSIPAIKDLLHRTLAEYTRQDSRAGLLVILSALNTRAGCLLTIGSTTPFHLHPVKVRQQILQGWNNSYLPPLRQAAKVLGFLFKSVWLKTSPTLGPVLGYPRAPVHGTPGKGYDYSFIQFPPGSEPETLETDVLIVGSGCGGGVCAKNLAEAGQRVLVVDRAYYFPPEYLPMSEKDGAIHLYQNGGIEVSDDASISILAGQAWGGGGTVNWSASLQTQDYVRQEWADEGMSFFTSAEFQSSLDRVCARMGVSTEFITHNKTNQVLKEGARKLGYSCKDVPQNTGGKAHYCGYCTEGCGSAEKQGPAVSWLPDAARAGANFIEGFDARKVIFETVDGKKTAVGVQGTWQSRDRNGGVDGPDKTTREVIIKAKRVISSGGTLQSPLFLLRSGLTNPHIGRNLHLHPVNLLCAIFPEAINPWEGSILTTVVDSLQNLDGRGHGVKLEAMNMLPSLVLPLFPWSSGADFKRLSSKFKNMVGFISLARDRDTGRIWADKVDGKTRIQYTPSAFDRRHVLEGIIALAKISYVAGAKELWVTTAGVEPFIVPSDNSSSADQDVNDPAFQAWLLKLRKKGVPLPDATFGSAHQMGTCRMATHARAGVVDQRGKVFGVEGLYVADASVFPSASGVNPMITNMAISDHTSREMAKELRGEQRRDGGARL